MVSVKGTFKNGLKIGNDTHREFELRAASTRDMVNAEDDCPVEKRFGFRLALAGQQLISIGALCGPISFDRVQELSPDDVETLLAKQGEVEALAKKTLSDDAGTTPSSPASARARGGAVTP